MEWNRGAVVGRGSTATVSIATAVATGEIFAVKSTELSRSALLRREKEILSQLSSPHIVEYRGDQITYEDDDTQIYNLFMEYVPRGSISDLIKQNGGGPIDESTIRIFAHQILLGLSYLHENGVVHCDIKGQNVLIGKDGVKIADLGCAKAVATSAISGTPAYMAPEVARGEEQSFPADVWALGCTLIEMATGSHPFPEEENPVSVLYRVGFKGYTPDIPEYLSAEAKDFLSKCFERDSKQRSTADELLKHPYVDDLKINSSEFEEFTRISPSSVLDHGFWDSLEVPESGPNSVHVSSGTNSPSERITGLIGLSGWNNWDGEEEDWISVRNHGNEEEIESSIEIIETQEIIDSLIFDRVDRIAAEYSDDVASFLICFSHVLRDLDDNASNCTLSLCNKGLLRN